MRICYVRNCVNQQTHLSGEAEARRELASAPRSGQPGHMVVPNQRVGLGHARAEYH